MPPKSATWSKIARFSRTACANVSLRDSNEQRDNPAGRSEALMAEKTIAEAGAKDKVERRGSVRRSFLALLALALLRIAASRADAQQPPTYLGYVTRVVDGDTIYVALGNQIESVRYIGINTPETH